MKKLFKIVLICGLCFSIVGCSKLKKIVVTNLGMKILFMIRGKAVFGFSFVMMHI